MTGKKISKELETQVVSLLAHLHDNGYQDIRSVAIGYEKPDEICWKTADRGYIPEVVALKEQEHVFAVETRDSITAPETEDRWRLFSTYAKQQAKKFVIVVPKESEEPAKQRVKELGIDVAGVWSVA